MSLQSLYGHYKRSRSPRRASRRAIKADLPAQGFDALARRKTFVIDMIDRGLPGHGCAALRGNAKAAKPCVAFRLVSLLLDPAVRYLPATGAP